MMRALEGMMRSGHAIVDDLFARAALLIKEGEVAEGRRGCPCASAR
jgi:hypothetical protein